MDKEETLNQFTKIVIETDDKKSVTIATITPDLVEVADGYRVKLTPRYD